MGRRKIGADDAVRAFAEELASNIPLPTDAKMIAVARDRFLNVRLGHPMSKGPPEPGLEELRTDRGPLEGER